MKRQQTLFSIENQYLRTRIDQSFVFIWKRNDDSASSFIFKQTNKSNDKIKHWNTIFECIAVTNKIIEFIYYFWFNSLIKITCTVFWNVIFFSSCINIILICVTMLKTTLRKKKCQQQKNESNTYMTFKKHWKSVNKTSLIQRSNFITKNIYSKNLTKKIW